MFLSKAVSVVSFFGALVIGVAAAWVVNPWWMDDLDVAKLLDQPPSRQGVSCRFTFKLLPVHAEDLRGRWTGTWGYDSDPNALDVDLDIDRVEGNQFYGTLRQRGAEIAIDGKFDADKRRIFFRETKIIKLGSFSSWSLGTNFGSFSANGRRLSGRGSDKWGTFGWEISKTE